MTDLSIVNGRIMASYREYQTLVSRIREAADALEAETEAYMRATSHSGPPSLIEADVKRSTEWLRHALKSLLMATVALRDAREQAARPLLPTPIEDG